jgi:hypothetical protein
MPDFVRKLIIFFSCIFIPALIFLFIYNIENRRQIIVDLTSDKQVMKGDGQEMATLTFTSKDLEGNPLSGHLVEIVLQGYGTIMQRRTKTDENGQAVLQYQNYRVTSFNGPSTITVEAYDCSVGSILEIRRKAEVSIQVGELKK